MGGGLLVVKVVGQNRAPLFFAIDTQRAIIQEHAAQFPVLASVPRLADVEPCAGLVAVDHDRRIRPGETLDKRGKL